MAGLATRRRTGVEDAFPLPRCKQVDGKLPGGVLDRHMACGEPRQRAHIGVRLDTYCILCERFAIAAKPRCLERVQLGRDVGPPGIDAQPEWRGGLVRAEG